MIKVKVVNKKLKTKKELLAALKTRNDLIKSLKKVAQNADLSKNLGGESTIRSVEAILDICFNSKGLHRRIWYGNLFFPDTKEGYYRLKMLLSNMRDNQCFSDFQLTFKPKDKIQFIILEKVQIEMIKEFLEKVRNLFRKNVSNSKVSYDGNQNQTKPVEGIFSQGDIKLGLNCFIKYTGLIYKNGSKESCKVGKAGAYLVRTLKNGNKLGSEDFKPKKRGANFAWTTIKNKKSEINKFCSGAIKTDAFGKYYMD